MKCNKCPHYRCGCTSNFCEVTGSENFRTQNECDLVNDDGSLNRDNEFIKMEYGTE